METDFGIKPTNITFSDRRSLLSPAESFGWQIVRNQSRGKLLELSRPEFACKMTKGISNLPARTFGSSIGPGYPLIITYIPICFNDYCGRENRTFAFVVLYNEGYYLLPIPERNIRHIYDCG